MAAREMFSCLNLRWRCDQNRVQYCELENSQDRCSKDIWLKLQLLEREFGLRTDDRRELSEEDESFYLGLIRDVNNFMDKTGWAKYADLNK